MDDDQVTVTWLPDPNWSDGDTAQLLRMLFGPLPEQPDVEIEDLQSPEVVR